MSPRLDEELKNEKRKPNKYGTQGKSVTACPAIKIMFEIREQVRESWLTPSKTCMLKAVGN